MIVRLPFGNAIVARRAVALFSSSAQVVILKLEISKFCRKDLHPPSLLPSCWLTALNLYKTLAANFTALTDDSDLKSVLEGLGTVAVVAKHIGLGWSATSERLTPQRQWNQDTKRFEPIRP
jgi:hypothetical protein